MSTTSRSRAIMRSVIPLGALALVALVYAACTSAPAENTIPIPVQPVKRGTISVTATASGLVEPIEIIEVKSKSAGRIVKMPVEIGTKVRAGDTIIQVDERDLRNALNQAQASFVADTTRRGVALRAKERASKLMNERIITAAENEAAIIDYSNSVAQVTRDSAAVEIAALALTEATTKAASMGTIIEKPVSVGAVVASAISGFSGGTTLVKMADLTKVRFRALFNEIDIGKIHVGMPARVTTDAFPDRPFMGVVEKIEPQATVQQSVTFFPVLITIANEDELLMPGMNGECVIETEHLEDVLTIPNDAVRTLAELGGIADALGISADSAQAMMKAGMQAGMAAPGGGKTTPGDSQKVGANAAQKPGDSTGAKGGAPNDTSRRGKMGGPNGGKGGPGGPNAGKDGKGQMMAGGGAGAGAGMGGMGMGGRGRGMMLRPGMRQNRPAPTVRPALVFVVDSPGKYSPRMVRVGTTDFNLTHVVSGLKEGEKVAVLNVVAMKAAIEAEKQDTKNWRNRFQALQKNSPGKK